jgi:hypothetical protein
LNKILIFLVVKLSDRFKELKQKRIELDATREAIVRQMQQLHAQISVRRKEGEIKITIFFFFNTFSSFQKEMHGNKNILLKEKKQLHLKNELDQYRYKYAL